MELDQFMKLFLVEFFNEIMRLFFPELAHRLDFTRKKDLNKDLYADPPQGAERFADVLLEVPVKNPPPEVILSHFESQQQNRFDFPARMLGYHCLIYGREIEAERRDSFTLAEFNAWENRKQLFSVAFCHYPLEAGITVQSYQMGLPNRRLICEYTGVSFPLLSAREYLDEDNVAVCVLAAFMDAGDFSPAELKVACYRKLVPYLPALTSARRDLIIHAIETYITLTAEEEQKYNDLIRDVYPEVNQMIVNPLIERGRQLGHQEGLQEGTIDAKQETLIDLMQLKFGVLPQSIVERVQSIAEVEQLDTFLRRVITTTRLDEMGLGNGVVARDSVET